jgi:hypothetical protein
MREDVVNISSLAKLGEIAGLAGVAVGMVAVIALAVIKRTSNLARAERAPMLRLVAIGAFTIGALGIVAWLVAGIQLGPSVMSGDCSIATNGAAGGNTVNCSAGPAAPATKP